MNQIYTSRVGAASNTINYSNNGNITYKTDAGSYTYDVTKLNEVASVTNPLGIIPTNSQTILYTGFNKAYQITDGTYVQDITCGPDNQRIKSVFKNNGAVIKTKYYAPGYDKEIKSGITRELHYVSCPYGLVAVLIKQGGTSTTYFTETDHLGSIIGLMNSSGTYIEQFSFDPWGRQRNPSNWTYTSFPQPVLIDRGFTGHVRETRFFGALANRKPFVEPIPTSKIVGKHYDNFGLIDMNGRMYDPVLGRFLGVDPIIQNAGNSQSINGYGYALNNPLKYTDPTGYSYKQTMDAWYGEGNYWYRGQAPGTWTDWESFHYGGGSAPVHNGNMTYQYNWGTGLYTDKFGRRVDYDEAHNNYVIPNSLLTLHGEYAQKYVNFLYETQKYECLNPPNSWT